MTAMARTADRAISVHGEGAGHGQAFQTSKLIGLPGVLRATSHLTMKTIKTAD